MSRESNDAFDAYAAREGYKPGTWNYIRAARAWQAALAYVESAVVSHGSTSTPVDAHEATNVSDNATGVAPTLAARPPALTNEQIDRIWNGMGSFSPNDHHYFAREVIKAAFSAGVAPNDGDTK